MPREPSSHAEVPLRSECAHASGSCSRDLESQSGSVTGNDEDSEVSEPPEIIRAVFDIIIPALYDDGSMHRDAAVEVLVGEGFEESDAQWAVDTYIEMDILAETGNGLEVIAR